MTVNVPADAFFLGVVMGLLKVGMFRYTWSGTDEQLDAVTERMKRMYLEYQEQAESCMTCEEIEDCIETSEAVQNALEQWFVDNVNNPAMQTALANSFNPTVSGGRVPDSYAQQNAYAINNTCNDDQAWGNIRTGLIDRSFQRVLDVLQDIELTTDNQEMLAQALNATPILGSVFDVIPITDWFLWFDNVRNWMYDAFVSGDDLEMRDSIACDLFCIWQENCSLSVEQIRDYYWQKTVELVPGWSGAFEGLATLIGALASSTEAFGDAVVYALVGSQYGFQSFINDWFGIHIDSVMTDLTVGGASDDWMTLCEDCPPVCLEPAWRIVNPVGTDGGSYDQTDNMDGTWTIVFTSAFSSGANRCAIVEANGCCWNVISAVYSMTPENLNNYYACGANPTDEDYGTGSVEGFVPEDACSAGVLASSVSSAFTVTLVVETCP